MVRLRELPALDGVDDARLDRRRLQRRALDDGRQHATGRRDGELRDDAPFQRRTLGQRLLVAILHLVQVAADDAPDDLLVERSPHGGVPDHRDRGRRRDACAARRRRCRSRGRSRTATSELAGRSERSAAADHPLVLAAAACAGAEGAEAAQCRTPDRRSWRPGCRGCLSPSEPMAGPSSKTDGERAGARRRRGPPGACCRDLRPHHARVLRSRLPLIVMRPLSCDLAVARLARWSRRRGRAAAPCGRVQIARVSTSGAVTSNGTTTVASHPV